MNLNIVLIQNGFVITISDGKQQNSFFSPSKEDALKAVETIFNGIEQALKPDNKVTPMPTNRK